MSAASTPGSAPNKTMSSRLLTMKFMQRAANASPVSASPSTPAEERSAKRRRTESEASPSTKRGVDSLVDRAAIQAAIAKEEVKNQAVLDRQAAEAGDAKWVLSFEDQKHTKESALSLRVVQMGWAHLDASPSKLRIEEGDFEDRPAMVGRRSFGRFNKVLEKQQNPAFEDSSASESEDEVKEESDSDDEDPIDQLFKNSQKMEADRAKAERKAKKRAAAEELEEMAKKRRKQDVNLNGLTSLSGKPAMECFRCGGPHRKQDCPNLGSDRKRQHEGGDGGRPKKAKKHS